MKEQDSKTILTRYSNIRRERSKKWSLQENSLFFRLLKQFGTDFSLFSMHFPDRSKRQIKNKFIRECRSNETLISDIVSPRCSTVFEDCILADTDNSDEQPLSPYREQF